MGLLPQSKVGFGRGEGIPSSGGVLAELCRKVTTQDQRSGRGQATITLSANHPALAHGCAQSRKCWFLAYERRTGSRGPVEQGLHEQIHLVPGLPE